MPPVTDTGDALNSGGERPLSGARSEAVDDEPDRLLHDHRQLEVVSGPVTRSNIVVLIPQARNMLRPSPAMSRAGPDMPHPREMLTKGAEVLGLREPTRDQQSRHAVCHFKHHRPFTSPGAPDSPA